MKFFMGRPEPEAEFERVGEGLVEAFESCFVSCLANEAALDEFAFSPK